MEMEGKTIVISTIMVMLWWSAVNCMTFDSTVAQDGSGKYKTITEALNAAPINSSKQYFIHVKKGIYNENVTIPNDKTNIALVGDGMGITIITASKSSKGFPTPNTATLEVYGSGFIGMSMTIRNTAGAEGGQAAALTTAPFRGFASFYQCRFVGYQDTIFSLDTAFFRECKIFGTVDFITGCGRAFFQNCLVKARQPIHGQVIRILAPGGDNITSNPGVILQNCNISHATDFNKSDVQSFLGWPWKNGGKGVIMSSYIGDFIDPQGWTANPEVTEIYLAEYNNRGPGSDTTHRVKWSKTIDKTEASKFTVRNFLQGDKWIPKLIPYYLDLDVGAEEYSG
ncbi:probable pectinesterase 30 [Solanum dulcamara]|uniref:probable pectinesterase 30 n=1 Tax=Solanum dulcamara TaxID=45834 RepID=UPI00248685F8|nr:probable pectinesterase 30 [Solanum dulcamara]